MASRRTAIWFLAAFLFFLVGFALFVWMLNRMVVGATPAVGARTVLHVELAGTIGEVSESTPFVTPLTVREIDDAVRRAADDDRVVGLFLDVGPLLSGFAKVQEIRAAVHAFRDQGKPTVALIELATATELYLASAAETVVQVPSGQTILGLLVEETFYKNLFDKIGVRFEAFHTGPYKTAFHSYTRTGLTDEQRSMEESLLDSIHGQWIGDIAADRGLEPTQVEESFDLGILLASEAAERGLVDRLGYRDTVVELLEEAAGGTVRQIGVRPYSRVSGDDGFGDLLGLDPVVALVHVGGLMVPGEMEGGLFGSDVAAGDTIARYLREAGEDEAVRAIVVRIESPGGAASAADVMAREARRAAERKPLIVSMSDVAASGGYWLASAGHRIFAHRATYTGSIGVVSGRLDLVGAYEKLGVDVEVLKRGANADLFSTATTLRSDQAERLDGNAQALYRDFLRVVAEGRGLPLGDVEAVAAGRVWTGEQALDNGLVDEIGGLREAIAHARLEAGISGRRTALRVYPPRRSLFQQLTQLFAFATTQARDPRSPLVWAERLRALGNAGPGWALAAMPLPAASR